MIFPVFRILCVEDDADSCELMEVILRQANDGYRITSVSTAQKALDIIKHQSFDLYVLDYLLPDQTGLELCRKIREIDSQTPIMFYTAMARSVDRETALAAGANRYLIKPTDFERLTETVKELLEQSSSVARRETHSSNQ